jgi:hypothetical protein
VPGVSLVAVRVVLKCRPSPLCAPFCVCGMAAQLSRTDRSTDAATVSALRAFGERLLPCLRDVEVLGTYRCVFRPRLQPRTYIWRFVHAVLR